MSNIKYLAYLKTVEFHSLTKAANLLGYTQPGISHMITSLEQELGFPLLIRDRNRLYPDRCFFQHLHPMGARPAAEIHGSSPKYPCSDNRGDDHRAAESLFRKLSGSGTHV